MRSHKLHTNIQYEEHRANFHKNIQDDADARRKDGMWLLKAKVPGPSKRKFTITILVDRKNNVTCICQNACKVIKVGADCWLHDDSDVGHVIKVGSRIKRLIVCYETTPMSVPF